MMHYLVIVTLGLTLSQTIAGVQFNRVVRKADVNNWSECGKSEKTDTSDKGPRFVTLGEHPWMTVLGYRADNKSDLSFLCGATLISDRWLVTAATCTKNTGKSKLVVARLGELDLDSNAKDGATPIDAAVEEAITHPEYSSSPFANDIALVKLKNQVTFTQYIRPACVLSGADYKKDSFYTGKSGLIAGWGSLEWGGKRQTKLHETSVSVVEPSKCSQAYSQQKSIHIDESVLCAGGGPGRDACQGDSGGPLVFPINNKFYLGGVISFGQKCFDPNYPGVYTRISTFTDWISKTTGLTF